MSDVSRGPGWWQASDGKWYSPETHPDNEAEPTAPGWWRASDGKWYPPELRPDEDAARPTEVQPAEAQSSDPTQPLPQVTTPVERPVEPAVIPATAGVPRRTLRTDVERLWRERRALILALGALGVVLVLALLVSLGDDDDGPDTVRTAVTTTRPPSTQPAVTTAPASTAAATTSSPSTSTTTTTSPPATTAPATTSPATTSPPVTTTPATTSTSRPG